MAKTAKKKIGIVRTDNHSLLYAACWGPYDRYQYRLAGAQLYIIENNKDGPYKHFRLEDAGNTPIHLENDVHMRNIPRDDTEIAGCWNVPLEEDRLSKEQFGRAFGCKVYDKLEDMADPNLFDGIAIGNCSFMAEDHVEYALPFIRQGIAMFIDKSFADNAANAKIILDAAREYNAPIFCSSILMFASANRKLKKMNLGDPRLIVSTKSSTMPQRNGSVHTLSNCLGAVWAMKGSYEIQSIQYIGNEDGKLGDEEYKEKYGAQPRYGEVYQLLFTDGTVGILNCNDFGDYAFRLDAYGSMGTATEYVVEQTMRSSILEIANEFADMIDTRIPPFHYDRIFEFVAALDAAEKSRAEGGRPVTIQEIADDVGYLLHRPMQTKY